MVPSRKGARVHPVHPVHPVKGLEPFIPSEQRACMKAIWVRTDAV